MSEAANNNRRSSRRKPLKTTRILAEIDDETGGTEFLCVTNDGQSGLCDVSSYESKPAGCQLSSEIDNNQTVCDDIPTTIVISSSSADDVNASTSNPTYYRRRGRPRKSLSRVIDDSSQLLPIDEYNVGPVLEKLIAMMQSMSMLLSALKNDLRHSNMPEHVVASKRDAATTQLWRAFLAYQKSFSEIEQFACLSKTANESSFEPVDVECKRLRVDAAETVEPSSPPTSESNAAVELVASSSDSSIAPLASTSAVSVNTVSDTFCS